MPRYIDAEELLHRLPNDLPYKASVRRVLILAPSADVQEVRRGKWVGTQYYTISMRGRRIRNTIYKCSVCGESNGRIKNPYCSHCGAKMKGGAEE